MRWQRPLAPSTRNGRAAQYLRMSTEHQQYSIANQSAVIALYAAAHGSGIIRSFVDEGKSGTTIKKRQGLQELLRVVETGEADFDQILVYDVSRWGRFPDTDESAHYEYLCKRAGIAVHYCAEQFENDNSTTSNLLKALKRTMAGEFSRELSVKLSAGMRRLASMGYWQGGYAPFGMARQLVGANGEPKQILNEGEWHGVNTDRTVLVPGDPREVETVKLAFDLYANGNKSRRQIVDILNQRSVLPRSGKPWTMSRLRRLLSADVYKGAYAYGKYAQRRLAPREKWTIRERSFRGIVPEEQWEEANRRIQKETQPYIDSEMLDALRRLWKRKGELNERLINKAKSVPSAVAYQKHFGSLNEAYKVIGYPIPRAYTYVHAITMMRRMRDKLCDEICNQVRTTGATAERRFGPGIIFVNGAVTVQITFATGRPRATPDLEWILNLRTAVRTDILVVALLYPPSQSILEFYILPAFAGFHGRIYVRNGLSAPCFELYRFPDLQALVGSFRCLSIWGAYETRNARQNEEKQKGSPLRSWSSPSRQVHGGGAETST
jgi:DNA invertase Pin-like site-specific DNA recombinase